MDNISVLIVEDTPSESEALQKMLLSNGFTVAGIAGNHREALQMILSVKVDVAIIDVFLEGAPEGITFAETINTLPDMACPFVFLTNSTDRSVFDRARLTKPYSFLLKPFNALEVIYALEMALEKFYGQQDVFHSDVQDTVISREFLFIKKNDALRKVALSAILYIEVEERYCTIYTESGKYVIMISLTRIVGLLDPARFCRTHRKYIVNLEKILEIQQTDHLLLLEGDHLIPVSEKYRDFIHRLRTLK